MKKFTLQSIELRNYNNKHICLNPKNIDGNKLLVTLETPIPNHLYNVSKDVCLVVLAPRYEGTSLNPEISEWPFYVNICLPEKENNFETGPYKLIDVGKLELIAED